MINRTAKGKRNEKKTEDYFMFNHGFIEWERAKASKFNSVDLFGLWDHIGVAEEHSFFEAESIDNKKIKIPMMFVPGDLIFIQTKTNQKQSRNAMEKHIGFKVNQHKILVVWIDRVTEPRIISLNE